MAEESKIYLGRLVQNKFWTPESKIYLGRLVQNKLVYNDERSAWERGKTFIFIVPTRRWRVATAFPRWRVGTRGRFPYEGKFFLNFDQEKIEKAEKLTIDDSSWPTPPYRTMTSGI
jgi:hypothetical protein